ncbi:hypothetical protein EVAR_83366_1 [Eumeta japonica]|uniref:Uncharacterized protein n=1 Tax=Eumeta variegata TaxID=151549 RepID=A0A4C1TZ11_EUMVA|nr:hypothetical protein EVAR_83366_1 [Eumeta japonica]
MRNHLARAKGFPPRDRVRKGRMKNGEKIREEGKRYENPRCFIQQRAKGFTRFSADVRPPARRSITEYTPLLKNKALYLSENFVTWPPHPSTRTQIGYRQ